MPMPMNAFGQMGAAFGGVPMMPGTQMMPYFGMPGHPHGQMQLANPLRERKRVRSACGQCHERKLRCVMQANGICQHCDNKRWPCVRRMEKKRGRPRTANKDTPSLTSNGDDPVATEAVDGVSAGALTLVESEEMSTSPAEYEEAHATAPAASL